MKDERNKQYGLWTVLGRDITPGPHTRWFCKCKCGREKSVTGLSLRNGKSKSCGCQNGKNPKRKARRLYLKHKQEYTSWNGMRTRCHNETREDYKYYGARGITVCDRWDSFDNFLEDMGKRPSPELTLERRDNDIGYTPDNCYWATRSQQNSNRRNIQ